MNELTDDKSLKFIATQRGRTCDQKAIPAQRQTAVCAALSWRAFNTEPRVSPGPGQKFEKEKLQPLSNQPLANGRLGTMKRILLYMTPFFI